MGVVYGGVHRQLGRPVAIKRVPHAVAEDPRMSERFEHEARLLARLDHPHIVPVYDYVRQQGEHLLVMERLDGGTVWSRFASDGLTAQQSCGIVLATLSGLHAAHEAGVLHLDVKPKNLLFTSNGVVKVDEASALLRLSRSKLYQMMAGGELPFVKLGKSRRIPTASRRSSSSREPCPDATAV